jgi:hypothetical protein
LYGAGTQYTQVAVVEDALTAGWSACGLRTDGEIECHAIWGSPVGPEVVPGPFVLIEGGPWLAGIDESGQLVDMYRGTVSVRSAESYVDVDVSGSLTGTSCAVRVGGDIECVGWDAYLGDIEPLAVYTKVAVDTNANAACGLTDLGEINCWGDPIPGAPPPVGTGFIDISIFDDVGCAIAADGSAACWGEDDGRRYPP